MGSFPTANLVSPNTVVFKVLRILDTTTILCFKRRYAYSPTSIVVKADVHLNFVSGTSARTVRQYNGKCDNRPHSAHTLMAPEFAQHDFPTKPRVKSRIGL